MIRSLDKLRYEYNSFSITSSFMLVHFMAAGRHWLQGEGTGEEIGAGGIRDGEVSA